MRENSLLTVIEISLRNRTTLSKVKESNSLMESTEQVLEGTTAGLSVIGIEVVLGNERDSV